MEISHRKQNEIVVLALKGKLDVFTSIELEKGLFDLIAKNERRLLIDCFQLENITSAGLRVMLSAAKQMKTVRGQIVFCGLNDRVKELFDISGFTQLFRIFPSQDDVLKELR